MSKTTEVYFNIINGEDERSSCIISFNEDNVHRRDLIKTISKLSAVIKTVTEDDSNSKLSGMSSNNSYYFMIKKWDGGHYDEISYKIEIKDSEIYLHKEDSDEYEYYPECITCNIDVSELLRVIGKIG